MPRRIKEEHDWDEDDSEGDDDDSADDDEERTVPCPYCKKQMHEASPRCPSCENYISEEDATSYKPWWIILGALVCLFIVYLWIVR